MQIDTYEPAIFSPPTWAHALIRTISPSNEPFHGFWTPSYLRGKHGKNYSKYMGKTENLTTNNSRKILVQKYLLIKNKKYWVMEYTNRIWGK